MPTFAVEGRRNAGRCVLCESPAIRVVVNVQKQWRRGVWRKVRFARRVCRACIDNIKGAIVP